MKHPPVHYHDYLGLDSLLSCQHRQSEKMGQPAHDEWLFITVHQAYELWFKQILFEVDSVLTVFAQDSVPDRELSTIVHRLERVRDILKFSIGQIDLMETMTPLDFLDFRDFLYPASGFQSSQFRLVETKLGLRNDDRMSYNQTSFVSHLSASQQEAINQALAADSLFDSVEKWLMRTPFLQIQGYDFWKTYQQAVLGMLNDDRDIVRTNPRLSEEARSKNLAMIDGTEKTFRALFDETSFNALREQGHFRLSFRALHAALFIQLYRDEPVLQQPHRLISCLVDLDEILTNWRYRHAQMALRMLGRKIGTGGSSGHDYLRETADRHRVFKDFVQLATFLIPRSKIPKLPDSLSESMGFAVSSKS